MDAALQLLLPEKKLTRIKESREGNKIKEKQERRTVEMKRNRKVKMKGKRKVKMKE